MVDLITRRGREPRLHPLSEAAEYILSDIPSLIEALRVLTILCVVGRPKITSPFPETSEKNV